VDTASNTVLARKVLADTTAVTITSAANVNTTLTIDFSGGVFTTPVTFIGGSGRNTLVGANVAETWNITGANAGKVGNVTFSNVANLVGGSASDAFKIRPAGSLSASVDGSGGGDWLDYSAFPATRPVIVNLVTGSATGVAGGIRNIQNVRGGAGNDTLTGNGGNILIGGAGSNILRDAYAGSAASGRSLLIGGGNGGHSLTAGGAGDLLISGTTTFDLNNAALMSILAEWQSTDDYLTRFNRLEGLQSGGLNGGNQLRWGSTVKDDATADVLTGSRTGLDWFFANLGQDTLNNLHRPSSEHVNNMP
jgi:hypothetical protein